MASNWEKRAGTRPARASQDAPLADVRSGARAVCPGLVLTRSGPRRAPSGEWRPAGRASGPAPVGGPVRRRAPVRPRPGPSGCVRPRPGPDLPSGAPSGTGLVASMLASARRRAPSGAKFPRPEVSVGRPVRRRRPDRTSGRGPFLSVARHRWRSSSNIWSPAARIILKFSLLSRFLCCFLARAKCRQRHSLVA
mgnify:CR=1 FL=1